MTKFKFNEGYAFPSEFNIAIEVEGSEYPINVRIGIVDARYVCTGTETEGNFTQEEIHEAKLFVLENIQNYTIGLPCLIEFDETAEHCWGSW